MPHRTLSLVVWSVALRIRDALKPLGLTGPIEQAAWRTALRLVPPPDHEVVAQLPGGAKLRLPPHAPSARTLQAGLYERATVALIQEMLSTGMSFVDVGAYAGYYTVIASRRVGASGQVYAFEPNNVSFSYLEANIAANGRHNVTAVQQAVGRASGIASFVERGEWSHLGDARTPVAVTSLDDFFAARRWPNVDLVKIDIEGGELDALAGMSTLSARNPRLRLVIEYNPETLARSGATWRDLARAFTDLGFRRCAVIDQRLRDVPLTARSLDRSLHNLFLTK